MGDNFEYDVEFRISLPSKFAERITETAPKERRSRNSQYVYMLENWFELKAKLGDLAEISNREKTVESTKAAG
jgi:DNA-binding transcriptional regulator/RsmH inhibitor MraZ